MDKIRVMLADDHILVREGTKELLEREDDLQESDWVPRTTHTCCPDPEGIVMRVEAL